MALPTNADVVVVHGYWIDEVSGQGVLRDDGRPSTITFEPVPLPSQSQDKTPNLRDNSAETFVKTRVRTAVVDPVTGYFAQVVVSSNDPDLDAYAGRRVTFLGEDPFTIEVPYNALLTTVSAQMAAKTGLAPNSQVRAIWLLDAALVVTPPPTPPTDYLTSVQTLSTLVSGILVHNGDLTSHPDIRSQMTANAAAASAALLAHTSNTSNPHAVTKAQVGLGNADNTSDVNKPISTAQQAGLDVRLAKSYNLSDLANATTARSNLGLGNVDNTSDVNKPISTAQQSGLDVRLAKSYNLSDLASISTAKTNLALDQVNNTSDANKPVSTATSTALAGKANSSHTHAVTDLTATGTRDATTFLRGDNTWAKATTRGTAVNGDAAATLTFGTSAPTQLWNTALTAARAVTLVAGTDGDHFRIVRTANATGSFNLNIGSGPLKALTTASTWVDLTYVGALSAWTVTASGSL